MMRPLLGFAASFSRLAFSRQPRAQQKNRERTGLSLSSSAKELLRAVCSLIVEYRYMCPPCFSEMKPAELTIK